MSDAPRAIEVVEGLELFRAPEGADVWFSWSVSDTGRGTLTAHINPTADQIKPDWFRAERTGRGQL